MIIDGRKIAGSILGRLRKLPQPREILAAVLVGQNPASVSFLKQKEKAAKSLGVAFKLYKLPSTVGAPELKRKIISLNRHPKIGGIIIQLPLPKKMNQSEMINLIGSHKDVDALKSSKRFLSPTVGTLKEILKAIKFNFENKKAVVVGRGFLVGQPIADWLRDKVQLLTITDKDNFGTALKAADLVVTGVGKPALITGSLIKKGSVIVDFGYSVTGRGLKRRVSGDVDFLSCQRKAAFITPTPGGTGPIVVAQLFENFYKLTRE